MVRVYNRTSEKLRRRRLRRETPQAEEVLWSKLRRRQMLGYKFRRQYSIEAYVVDFYCPTARLAIEVDGDSHFQQGSAARDEARQAAIESFGIHFLRFRNVEIFEHLDGVLAAIGRCLLDLRTPLKSPLVQGGTGSEKTRPAFSSQLSAEAKKPKGARDMAGLGHVGWLIAEG